MEEPLVAKFGITAAGTAHSFFAVLLGKTLRYRKSGLRNPGAEPAVFAAARD